MKYIKYKIECQNCGKEIIHTNADYTQDDSNIVNIDLDFVLTDMCFYCEDCGAEHYVSLDIEYEINKGCYDNSECDDEGNYEEDEEY